jgi:hypothetical protein
VPCKKQPHCKEFILSKEYEAHTCKPKPEPKPERRPEGGRRRILEINNRIRRLDDREGGREDNIHGDNHLMRDRNCCVRCCIRFQRNSTDRNDGLNAVASVFIYTLDFLV